VKQPPIVRGLRTASGSICALAGLLLSSCVAIDETDYGSTANAVASSPTDPPSGPPDAVPPPPPTPQEITIEPRRSLVVTDQTILARFSFQRVMDQLVQQSGVTGLTSLDLFHQWWDTQNLGPGLGLGAHCDDTVDAAGLPILNGFPLQCRPTPFEGRLAAVNPFTDPGTNPDEYIPIGLFNRFDLAPGDGSNCGEYRIVYARRGGITNALDRNLIIFEAALANPHPQQELKGCRRIVDFWADLTNTPSLTDRATKLEQFYFTGIPSVPPVIHVDHLGGGPSGKGQVRTNQFLAELMSPRVWSLREFKLVRTCAAGVCTAMRFVPVMVKGNPFGGLFSPGSTHEQAAAFRAHLISQVEALAAPVLTDIDISVPEVFDSPQSQASGTTENNYLVQFGTDTPNEFRDALAAQLTTLGSALTPEQIVVRAQSLSCAGCHRLSNGIELGGNLAWPSSIGFVHVTERETEIVDGETRFRISPALIDNFLPKRKQVMEDYLNDKLKSPRRPTDPIGGRRVH